MNYILFFLLFCVSLFFSYKQGQYSEEKKHKEQLRKKQEEYNKLKARTFDDVLKQLKNGLFILLLFLSACCKTMYYSPEPQEYTVEEQQEIVRIMEKENSPILNKFIYDYYNLRLKYRVENGL